MTVTSTEIFIYITALIILFITSSISGVDADKFLIRDTMWGTQIFFAERPVFSSPSDNRSPRTSHLSLTPVILH